MIFKIFPIIALILLTSCFDDSSFKEKVKYEDPGERLNRAQENTDHLFKELNE